MDGLPVCSGSFSVTQGAPRGDDLELHPNVFTYLSTNNLRRPRLRSLTIVFMTYNDRSSDMTSSCNVR